MAKADRARRMVTSETVVKRKTLRGVYAVKHETQQTRAAVQVLSLIDNMKHIMQNEQNEADTARD